MMIRDGVLSIAIIALAACGAEAEEEDRQEVPETIEAPANQPESEETETGQEDVIEAEVAEAQIPERYHGVWDYEGGTCAPESDLRMEIKAREIVFYESIGTVSGAREDGDDAIADLAMEGEGETWEDSLRLSLVGDSEAQRLHTSDATEPKVLDDLPRKRCE